MKVYGKGVCFLLSIVLFALSVHAQEHQSLRGRVLDPQGEAVVGAVVSCIELPDSTALAHCVTSVEGVFQFTELNGPGEKYLLEVSHLGYERAYVKPASEETVITLRESATAMEEVVVRGAAPRLKQKPGKFIYTPHLMEVQGLDSYDLLHYTPLVTLENNSVSILGKGTSTIYINGRKPLMDNASLMEMLRSIPAGQIENIEIIMSPNSSYSASTTGGVLNIVMKKNPSQGFNGSASISGEYLGERVSPRTSLYVGYSRKKFNASANLSYAYHNSQSETDETYNYTATSTDIFNSNRQESSGHFLGANLNMTYDLTKRSVVGASFHVGSSKYNSNSTTRSSNYRNGVLDKSSMAVSQTDSPFRRPEMSVVAYYNLRTDNKGSNLDISANYSTSLNASLGRMEYANATDTTGFVPYSLFQQNSTVDSYGYEFKGSYKHCFDEGNSLSAGYAFNASHLSNDFIRNDFDGSEYVPNTTLSNHFIYEEKVHALYVSYERKWCDVLSTSLGMRAEHTGIDGNQMTSREKFHRNYWNFFPELSIYVDLADGDHGISLDVSRSITRPFYNNLNPFKIWTSENTYTMGNVHLKPMIYNDVDLSYSFLNDYIIGASYSYGSDAFSDYTYSAEDNTTVRSIANFGHEQSLSFYFNMDKVFFKGVWRMSLSASADYDVTDGTIDGNDVSYKSWMGNAGIRNVFRISQKRSIRASMSYNYYTPSRGILKKGHHKHLLNVSLSKVFKFGGALSIDALNLLNYKPSDHYVTDAYSYNIDPRTNNITIQMRYSHKFGRSRVRGADDHSDTKHLGRFKK